MYTSHKRFTVFSFYKKINNSIHRYLKNAICIIFFNVNYSDTTWSCLFHRATVNAIYGNTFKARSQTSVNKHNPICEICFILFISGVISIIVQKNTLCTSKIRVIYFCRNCVNFLPENIYFFLFFGVHLLPTPYPPTLSPSPYAYVTLLSFHANLI